MEKIGVTKRILLIRHGQTDWNSEGRWQGMIDVPLNTTGSAQAEALAAHLRQRPVTAIYSSDLQRAAKTAQPLARLLTLPVKTDTRLREINLGIFQGLTYPEMSERYPTQLQQMRADYMGFVFPQGESRLMMQNRLYAFWEEMMAAETGAEEIVVVTHGGALRVLMMRLFEQESVRSLDFGNTSVTILEQTEDGLQIVQVASTMHLSDNGYSLNEA